jgi:hypothetical protein
MGIFGRKKREDQKVYPPESASGPTPEHASHPKEVREIPVRIIPPASAQVPVNAAPPQPYQVPQPKEDAGSPPAFAPIFIKLTRYRQILNNMNQIRYSLSLIRNQLMIMNELDSLRAENMKALQTGIEKVNNKLTKLDSELVRPTGFMQEAPQVPMDMQLEEVEMLEGTITDLRAQIEGLKQEVNALQ